MSMSDLSFICNQSRQKILRDGYKIARWKKKEFGKKIVFAIGDSSKSGKNGKPIFPDFEEKCHKSVLRPKWDILGVKWRYGAFSKWENAKIEIRLVPPPLKVFKRISEKYKATRLKFFTSFWTQFTSLMGCNWDQELHIKRI